MGSKSAWGSIWAWRNGQRCWELMRVQRCAGSDWSTQALASARWCACIRCRSSLCRCKPSD